MRMGKAGIWLWIASGLLISLGQATVQAEVDILPFNGKDLSGWAAEGDAKVKSGPDAGKAVWSVKNGMIRCEGLGDLASCGIPLANLAISNGNSITALMPPNYPPMPKPEPNPK